MTFPTINAASPRNLLRAHGFVAAHAWAWAALYWKNASEIEGLAESVPYIKMMQ